MDAAANRSIGGGPLDYEEYEPPTHGSIEDDRLTVASEDPLRARGHVSPTKQDASGLPLQRSFSSVQAAVTCIPSSIPAPATGSSFLRENRVSLLGEKTKLLSSAHLGGSYLPSADRESFAKMHKLVEDPLTRCPELDETVKDYAKSLNVSLDLRHDDILRDIGRRVGDAWHPLLALHEVAERHAEDQTLMDPHSVMNFAAYIAKYLAAATQKISFYRRHAILNTLDSAVKKQTASGATKFGFRQPAFRKGSMSLATRALLEKTPLDSAALSTSRSGIPMPLLFGGKLIDQLVEKSEDTTKTQKGFDHLLTARYGQSALKNAKRGSQTSGYPVAKRGRWDNSAGFSSAGSARFQSGESFRRPPFSQQRFFRGNRGGGRRWDNPSTQSDSRFRSDAAPPLHDSKSRPAK